MNNIVAHILNAAMSAAIGGLLTHCAVSPAHAQSVPFNSYSVSTLGGNCTAQGSVLYQSANGQSVCLGAGANGQVLMSGGPSANVHWNTVTGTGTVTSVGVTAPSIFSVTGSPITAAGTIALGLASESANTVWAAPNGSAGNPAFRSLVAADIPNLTTAKITSGTFGLSFIPNLDAAHMPAFSGDCATSAGSTVTSCATVNGLPVISETDTIASLKAITPSNAAIIGKIYVSGYSTVGDGGGGTFTWSAASSAADNSCTIFDPTAAPASGRWLRTMPDPSTISVSQCGGFTGTTDIGAVISTATAALPATGGTIFIPGAGSTYNISSTVIVPSHVKITGPAVGVNAGSGGAVNLVWNGSNSTAIIFDARGTVGATFEHFGLQVPSAYSGHLIDIGDATLGQVSSFARLFDMTLVANSGAVGNATCLMANRSIGWTVDTVNFSNCAPAIRGITDTGTQQSTTATIIRSQFVASKDFPIYCGGNQWNISYSIFEASYTGLAQAFTYCQALPSSSMHFDHNWFGDVTATGGTWIATSTDPIDGLSIENNFMGGMSTSTIAVGISANVNGFSFRNNTLNTFSTAISVSSNSVFVNGEVTSNRAETTIPCITAGYNYSFLARYGNTGFTPACEMRTTGTTAYATGANGIITEWLSGTVTAGTPLALTFPLAFPNLCANAQISLVQPTNTSNVGSFAGACTTTGVTINSSGSGSSRYNVLVTGY